MTNQNPDIDLDAIRARLDAIKLIRGLTDENPPMNWLDLWFEHNDPDYLDDFLRYAPSDIRALVAEVERLRAQSAPVATADEEA